MKFYDHLTNAFLCMCIPILGLGVVTILTDDHYQHLADAASENHSQTLSLTQTTTDKLNEDGGRFLKDFAPRLSLDEKIDNTNEINENIRFSEGFMNDFYEAIPGVNNYMRERVQSNKLESENNRLLVQLSAFESAKETCKVISENTPSTINISQYSSIIFAKPENIALNVEYCGQGNEAYTKRLLEASKTYAKNQ